MFPCADESNQNGGYDYAHAQSDHSNVFEKELLIINGHNLRMIVRTDSKPEQVVPLSE